MQWAKKQVGFTIVELLIVVVVIAILAAITIVAYNGIRDRATASSMQSAASQAGKKILAFAPQNNDNFPLEVSYTQDVGLPATTPQSTYDYYVSDDRKSFCLSVTDTTKTPEVGYAFTQAGSVVVGRCVKNFAPNPQLITNSAYWANQTPSGSTVGRIAGLGQSGQPVFSVVTTSSGQLRIMFRDSSSTPQVVSAGDILTVSYALSSDVAVSNVGVEVNFGGWVYTQGTPITTGWNRYTTAVTAPAGGTSFIQVQILSQVGVPANATFRVTDAMITKGTTVYAFASPSTNATWAWTAGASTSSSFGPALSR